MLNQILLGDCAETLKSLPDACCDSLISDPPYSLTARNNSKGGFMGAAWDVLPSVEIWRECLRVLKPGAFAFVISSPRQRELALMITRLAEAGFDVGFTSLYWTYATGMPKGSNVSKLVDKKLGATREVTGTDRKFGRADSGIYQFNDGSKEDKYEFARTDKPATPEALALDGSWTGYQPKPAVEVVIVAMKPLAQKTFVAQAMANRKGVTWLGDCRIPSETPVESSGTISPNWRAKEGRTDMQPAKPSVSDSRFAANLVVSDSALGEASKYFDLDKWSLSLPARLREHFEKSASLPFLVVPKASRQEKAGNPHLTVKPLKLMSYLVTLGSRRGDVVLDPFAGSGTTLCSCVHLGRDFIGCELSPEHKAIAEARITQARQDLNTAN